MNKLQELMNRCKCGVYVTVNEHRDTYETVESWLHEQGADISDSVKSEMITRNTLISVQFYPETPISFHVIYHFSLDAALSEALRCIDVPHSRIAHIDEDTYTPEKEPAVKPSAWATQTGGSHYKDMKIQPMEYSMNNNLSALQHTIIKYVSRFRGKNGIVDLEKGRHCIDMLIEWEQKNED